MIFLFAVHLFLSAPPSLTRAPAVAHFAPATYPAGEHGRVEVVVRLVLDATGHVSAVSSESQAHKSFVDAALLAAKELVFTPAEVDGAPAAIQLDFRYTFTEDLAASQPASLASEAASVPATLPAGDARLSGEVREAGSRRRLANVSLALSVGDWSAESKSDSKGQFVFANVPSGPGQVVIADSAHLSQKRELVFEAHIENKLTIFLHKARVDPFETFIIGKKDETEVQKIVIPHDEMVKLPGSYGDPLRAIQNLPGIGRSPFGLGLLVIRGADPSDSEYVIDGVHLDYLYHFGALTSVISEKVISDVTYLPGNFGARYGRATAGIIEVHTTPTEPETLRLKASVDLAQATLFAQIPIGDSTTITVAGRRSYIDALLPALLPQLVSNAPTVLPVYYDYQLRIGHKSQKFGDFTLSFYGADDQLVLAQAAGKTTGTFNPTSLHYESGFVSVQPRWVWKISPGVTSDASVLGTYELLHVNTPQASYNQIDWQFGGREEVSVKLAPSASFIVGLDGFSDTLDFSAKLPISLPFPVFPSPLSLNPPTSNFASKGTSYDVATYGEFSLHLGNLRLVPGLRVGILGTAVHPVQSLQPRLVARYTLTKTIDLKAGSGIYQKYPASPGIVPGQGNPGLGPQSAWQNSIGGEWQVTPWLSLDAVGFFNYLWDEVSSTDKVLIENGRPVPLLYDNNQQGRIYGAEFFLRAKAYKGFFGWISYTLSKSERINQQYDYWHLFDFDQTHVLTIVGSYKLPYDFQVGLRFRLTSGNPTTPVLRAQFDADTGGYSPVNGRYNSDRLPLFHQLDLRIDRTFVFNKWQLGIYVDVQNVYNQKNVEFYQYSYDFRTRNYIYGLPILPVAGIEGEY